MSTVDAPALAAGYRIELFGEGCTVGPNQVLDLWAREGVVGGEEARRRVYEVLLVGLHETAGLVAVTTAYLQRNAQLGMDMWYSRAFVASEHRLSNVAVVLAIQGRDLLEERFVAGEDRRADGMIYEVENEGLKQRFPEALWLPTEFTFIGENARGDHVRVRYFRGATVPAPSAAA